MTRRWHATLVVALAMTIPPVGCSEVNAPPGGRHFSPTSALHRSLVVYDDYGASYSLDAVNQRILTGDGKVIAMDADVTAEALNVFNAFDEDIPAQVATTDTTCGAGRDPSTCDATDRARGDGPMMARLPAGTVAPTGSLGPTAEGQATLALFAARLRHPPQHVILLRPSALPEPTSPPRGLHPTTPIHKDDVTDILSGPGPGGFSCYDIAYAIYQLSPSYYQHKTDVGNFLTNLFHELTPHIDPQTGAPTVDLDKAASQTLGFDNIAGDVLYNQIQLSVLANYYQALGCWNNKWADAAATPPALVYVCSVKNQDVSFDGGQTWTSMEVRECGYQKQI
jgi:hypothetical protein